MNKIKIFKSNIILSIKEWKSQIKDRIELIDSIIEDQNNIKEFDSCDWCCFVPLNFNNNPMCQYCPASGFKDNEYACRNNVLQKTRFMLHELEHIESKKILHNAKLHKKNLIEITNTWLER
jgi:hypothetical protein